jgi:hypothetical protein
MGRLIAVLALAGAAAFAARPSPNAHARLAASGSAAAAVARPADFVQAEKDLAGREAELGLVGAAPLFGAEGLPKPTR